VIILNQRTLIKLKSSNIFLKIKLKKYTIMPPENNKNIR